MEVYYTFDFSEILYVYGAVVFMDQSVAAPEVFLDGVIVVVNFIVHYFSP